MAKKSSKKKTHNKMPDYVPIIFVVMITMLLIVLTDKIFRLALY